MLLLIPFEILMKIEFNYSTDQNSNKNWRFFLFLLQHYFVDGTESGFPFFLLQLLSFSDFDKRCNGFEETWNIFLGSRFFYWGTEAAKLNEWTIFVGAYNLTSSNSKGTYRSRMHNVLPKNGPEKCKKLLKGRWVVDTSEWRNYLA